MKQMASGLKHLRPELGTIKIQFLPTLLGFQPLFFYNSFLTSTLFYFGPSQ